MAEPSDKSQGDFYTDMSVGEILRRGREHYGQSLEDVERNLRIRAIQLHAIETGNLEQLPGKAYALGFVRSYSEYLGLDGEKMVQLFKRQSVGGGKLKPSLNFPAPASESKIPTFPVAGVLAVLGIVFIGVWIAGRTDESPAPEVMPVEEVASVAAAEGGESAAPVSPEGTDITATALQPSAVASGAEDAAQASPATDAAAVAATDNTAVSAPVDAATNAANIPPSTDPAGAAVTTGAEPVATDAAQSEQSAQEEQGIILNVKENSWVEIRDADGNAIVSRVLKAGDQYFVPDRPDLRMNLGNASGVEVVIDGKALPVLGRRGEVKRNIALDSKSLKALAGAQ